MDEMNRLKKKLMRFFATYRTYLQDEDLALAKALSADEWGKILDEAIKRRTPFSEQ